MPSSPEITASEARSPEITAWQPMPLHALSTVVMRTEAPAFEPNASTRPTLHAFSVSPSAGIPADLLAAETAAARAAGYADGWAHGLDEAREATRARQAAEADAAAAADAERELLQRRAFDAIFDAAESLEQRAVPSATDIEEQILAAAWTIASALVGDVLADATTRSEAAVRRALVIAPADEDVTITVSPADFGVLSGGQAGTSIRRDRGLRTVTIVSDPSLADGDAIASCGATTIDARLTAALTRVTEVLAP